MNRLLVNVVGFQAGWFGCVLGAANGYPLIGPAVVLIVIGLHLASVARPAPELTLMLAAASLGAFFDSVLVQTGWLSYPTGTIWPGTAPYWIVAMWVLFATTLNVSMRWLRGRPLTAIAFGAVGGPLSYLGGARLGGLTFLDQDAALVALAVGWGLMTPLLVTLSQRLDGVEDPSNTVGQHA